MLKAVLQVNKFSKNRRCRLFAGAAGTVAGVTCLFPAACDAAGAFPKDFFAAGSFLLPVLLGAACLLLLVLLFLQLLKNKRLSAALDKTLKENQDLERTETIYRMLENNIHDVIFIMDMDFRFTYISPSVQRQRGFTVEEAMARDLSQTLTPDSARRITELVTRGLARIEKGKEVKSPLVISIETYCKDGSTRPCELTADLLYTDDGRPSGMIGVSRYIDDREKVKSELQLFKQAVEGSSEAIGLSTPAGEHFYHNRAFCELLGYKSPEAVQRDGGPMSLYKDRKQAQEIFANLRNGEVWTGEIEMRHRDGTKISVFLKADVIRDEYGSVLALMGSMTDISHIKERETAVQRQESLYRLLADNITEIISIINLKDLSTIYVSPSIEKNRGYTPEETMSQSLSETLTPESHELATSVIAEELERDGRPGVDPDRFRTLELEQYCQDGSTIWTEVVASFLRNPQGRPASILTAARDITERKEAESAIRTSEERYRMLAENISEAIYTIDLRTLEHTYVSPSVKHMYGFTPEEFMARPIEEVMTPASLDLTVKKVAEELEKDNRPGVDPDRQIPLELELYRKDGSTIWVETTVKALRDKSGTPVSALGVARDITERKKAEAEIREREELYRLLADNITEIIAIIDFNNMSVLYVSPSIEKLKGFAVEESLRLPLDHQLTPDSYQQALQAIAEELDKDGRPGVDPERHRILELEQCCKDGSTLWTEVAATFLRDEKGKPVSMLTVSRDITERKRAEASMKRAKEMAEAASRAKSEFLANMSHEIRTPLNGVIGMTELLLDTGLSGEQQEYAESVQNSAEALLVIINDLLDFSKIEAGKLRLDIVNFNLDEVFKQIKEMLAPRAGRKQIEYSMVIQQNAPRLLRGDPVRLRQILVNLCENAIKFTEEGGEVKVAVSVSQQTETTVDLLFEVKDTGIGISGEHQQVIFESFSQVDTSNTRQYGGTGLGLAITKRLVSLLNGEIGLASEPGKGSVFWFNIPLEKQDRQIPADSAADFPAAALFDMKSLKILLAEDSATSRHVLVQMLEKMGHTAVAAADGAEAVRLFAEDAFDLVLMDIQMPVMDGISATREIQSLQRDRNKKAPVIAVTASAMAGDRERFLSQGLDDYIAKPVTMKCLIEVIRRNAG